MKLMLVASAGGHLAQLLALRSLWEHHDRAWATFRLPEVEAALIGETAYWVHHPTTRNLPNAVRNLRLAWRSLRLERPDAVISTGAAVSVSYFIAARLLGIPTVFIEAYDRITMPTLSARLCYPFCDLFVVQWDQQQEAFPESVNIGAVL